MLSLASRPGLLLALTAVHGLEPASEVPPDPHAICFASNRAGGMDLYLLEPGADSLRRLANDGSSYAPSWSPDGRRCAFNSHRNGGWNLWVLDLDGDAAPRRVTRTPRGGFRYEYFPA